jgi:hypothetical protein
MTEFIEYSAGYLISDADGHAPDQLVGATVRRDPAGAQQLTVRSVQLQPDGFVVRGTITGGNAALGEDGVEGGLSFDADDHLYVSWPSPEEAKARLLEKLRGDPDLPDLTAEQLAEQEAAENPAPAGTVHVDLRALGGLASLAATARPVAAGEAPAGRVLPAFPPPTEWVQTTVKLPQVVLDALGDAADERMIGRNLLLANVVRLGLAALPPAPQ